MTYASVMGVKLYGDLIPCSFYDFLNPLDLFSPPHTCHVETAFYSSLCPKCSESAPSLGLQLFLHVHLCHTTVLSLFIVSLVWETGDFLRSFEQTPLLLNFHDKSVLCTRERQRAQLSWPGEIISRLKKTIII